MVYKIPTGLIKDKSSKPKKPLTLAEKEKIAETYAKTHAKRRAEMYAKFLPGYYERKPLERTIKRKRNDRLKDVDVDIEETRFWNGIEELRKPQPKKAPVKKRKVVKKEIEVVIDPNTGIIREKPHKKVIPRNLEDLKRIKVLKDEIEALKARMVRKDATIKNLKRKVEKLKNIIESPIKEEQRQLKELVDNPDFLEI